MEPVCQRFHQARTRIRQDWLVRISDQKSDAAKAGTSHGNRKCTGEIATMHYELHLKPKA